MKNQLQEYCIPYWQVNMINRATEYSRDMAIWSRLYLLSAYTGLGNQEEVFARFYRVPYEFGNTLRLIFGEDIANGYTSLLANQITITRDLIDAQINGDVESVNRNAVMLYQNADARAAYLSQINPYWDQSALRNLMYNYIRLTLDESTAFLSNDFNTSIDIFDRLLWHATQTGNYDSEGLFNYLLSPPTV